MVFDRRGQRLQATADTAVSVDHVKNIAAFPLAIPLIAGPGAITAMILLAGKSEGQMNYLAGLFGVTALVMLSCYVASFWPSASQISGLRGTPLSRACWASSWLPLQYNSSSTA